MNFSLPNQEIHVFLIGIILIFMFSTATGEELNQSEHPYRIGVLLPASGDSAMDFYDTLNWTVEGLQREGIGGPIELVCVDTSTEPIGEAARRMIEDSTIRVVIGPATSDEIFQIAPDFIRAKKLLISPSATSGKISEKFNPSGYIWRTTGGDRIQTRIIMDLLADRETKSVGLLYENNTYGMTFADWAGPYANELGMNFTGAVSFENGGDISSPLASASSDSPDYLIVAARGSNAAEITRMIHKQNSPAKLFFTDAGRSETFIESAKADAEGAEGLAPTADKKTGFFVAYDEHFDKMPSDYAALTRDALILAVSALARMDVDPSEDPNMALQTVLSGRDCEVAWDDQGVAQAIRLIRAGYLPDITGASGPLDYNTNEGADPLTTWYVHWRVEEGEFLADSYIPGSMSNEKESGITPSPGGVTDISSGITWDDPRPLITFVYNGDKGDFGFTDQAYLGLLKVRKDLNLTLREMYTGNFDSDYEPDPVISDVDGKRADLVLFLGSYMTGYAGRVAEQYPDVPVIVIDTDPVSVPNIKSVSFSMNGASYLAGILAANQTKTGKIAVIAGRDAEVIRSFTDGFVEGAARENPNVQVNVTFIADDNSGYSQPENASLIAEDMYRNGTDIIFTVAGESGLGAISAAKHLSDLKIIGVDSDQSYLGPGVIIASVIKNLEPVVYREVKEGIGGSYSPGLEVIGIANNGSSVAVNPRFENLSSIIEGRFDEAGEQEMKYSHL